MQNTLKHQLNDLQNASGKIVITTHHKPDGDAMGSSLGLYLYLKNAGIESTVIAPTDYNESLLWLPGTDSVLIYEEKKDESLDKIADSEFVFCLDFNALSRINEMGEAIEKCDAKIILIDHHRDPQDFDNERLTDIYASSTCELIYDYLSQHLGGEFIDENVAQCLYTGLITDTGSFRYDSTSSKTIRTAAALLDLGAKPSVIYDEIFDKNRLERLQLLGYFLCNKIEVIEDGKVALCHLTLDELEKYNVRTGDTEGFVNYGLSINGVQMSALIIDRGPLVKMSFRSKGNFPCNEFSNEYFNGGGHKNAAGGASNESLEATIEKFKKAIKAYAHHLA